MTSIEHVHELVLIKKEQRCQIIGMLSLIGFCKILLIQTDCLKMQQLVYFIFVCAFLNICHKITFSMYEGNVYLMSTFFHSIPTLYMTFLARYNTLLAHCNVLFASYNMFRTLRCASCTLCVSQASCTQFISGFVLPTLLSVINIQKQVELS